MTTLVSKFSEVALTAIIREYGPMRHASKILAKHARTSHRTAEAWLSGRSAPSGENFINLMAESEGFAKDIHRLIEERKNKQV